MPRPAGGLQRAPPFDTKLRRESRAITADHAIKCAIPGNQVDGDYYYFLTRSCFHSYEFCVTTGAILPEAPGLHALISRYLGGQHGQHYLLGPCTRIVENLWL